MKTRFVDRSRLKEASAYLPFGVVHETDKSAVTHSGRLLIAGN